jgi:hypothetical protein
LRRGFALKQIVRAGPGDLYKEIGGERAFKIGESLYLSQAFFTPLA